MIKRFYAHNFRTLVNFTIEFDKMNLLMGSNGAGKSTVLDALYKLRLLLSENAIRVQDLFSLEDFTKWEKVPAQVQRFEISIDDEQGTYEYKLTIEHQSEEKKSRIGYEELLHDGKPLYKFDVKNGNGQAKLYRDDYSEGGEYLFDWSRSGIGALGEKPFNKKLTRFRNIFQSLFMVKINLPALTSEASSEDEMPTLDLQNFASWYRHLSQSRQGQVFELTTRLREVIPGFDSMNLVAAGESKLLNVDFKGENGASITYRFSQLSDGQKILIILYTLLHCLPKKDVVLCVDEPENYLALPEVQFWLDALEEQVENEQKQAILISHHPRVINYLAADAGQWLYREGAGMPTRIKPVTIEDDGLPASKLVEMGWIIND